MDGGLSRKFAHVPTFLERETESGSVKTNLRDEPNEREENKWTWKPGKETLPRFHHQRDPFSRGQMDALICQALLITLDARDSFSSTDQGKRPF